MAERPQVDRLEALLDLVRSWRDLDWAFEQEAEKGYDIDRPPQRILDLAQHRAEAADALRSALSELVEQHDLDSKTLAAVMARARFAESELERGDSENQTLCERIRQLEQDVKEARDLACEYWDSSIDPPLPWETTP